MTDSAQTKTVLNSTACDLNLHLPTPEPAWRSARRGPEGENFDLKGAMTIPIRQIPRF
jgi:hypothetical protein